MQSGSQGEIEPSAMTVKKTILCVDDEQSLSIQKLTLETRGYRVVTCKPRWMRSIFSINAAWTWC